MSNEKEAPPVGELECRQIDGALWWATRSTWAKYDAVAQLPQRLSLDDDPPGTLFGRPVVVTN